MNRWLRAAAVLVGVGLLTWAVAAVGWPALWQSLRRVGWWVVPIVGFYLVIFGLDTWGWHYAFSTSRAASWRSLFLTRMAGEAVNYVTPFAWIGGEPVKAYLLKRGHGVSMTDGMSSVVIAKTALVIGLLFFALCGLGLVWWRGIGSASLAQVSRTVLVVLMLLVGVFLAVQHHGIFRRLAPWASKVLGSMAPDGVQAHEVDSAIRQFYRSQRGRLALSVGFHFLGWVAGALEVWLILYVLGLPVTLAQCWVIESLWQLLKAGAFLIPAGVGAQEGGILLVFLGLGLSLPIGLAMAVVRRLREFVWTAAGLVVWSRYEYGFTRE